MSDVDKKVNRAWKMILFSAIAVSLMQAGCSQPLENNAKQAIISFKKGDNLICQVSFGNRASLLINKHNGWSLYKKQYFKKGEQLLSVGFCNVESEK